MPTLGSIEYEKDAPSLEFLGLSEGLIEVKIPDRNVLGGLPIGDGG